MRTWCEVRNFASQKFRLTPLNQGGWVYLISPMIQLCDFSILLDQGRLFSLFGLLHVFRGRTRFLTTVEFA